MKYLEHNKSNDSASKLFTDVKTTIAKEKKLIAARKAADDAAAKKAAEEKAAAEAEAARIAAEKAAAEAQALLDAQRARDAANNNKFVSPSFTPGNDYEWGNCTWYVANRRATPAGLGNARDWLENAQKKGMLTGDVPKVGAIAWHFPAPNTYGHVAVVEAIGLDGSVTISEMNVYGLGVINQRVLPTISDWKFIY